MLRKEVTATNNNENVTLLPISADEFKASGAVNCEGAVRCKTVKFSGAANCCDVEAESFRSAGALECGGLINAENVVIRFDGQSSVKAIGGSTVDIAPDGTDIPGEEKKPNSSSSVFFHIKRKPAAQGKKRARLSAKASRVTK